MANGVEDEMKPVQSLIGKKEGVLKELHSLRQLLDQLYQKNVKLDEENMMLKKEVREMKRQISGVIDMMRILREDLKKAHEILMKPETPTKANLMTSVTV